MSEFTWRPAFSAIVDWIADYEDDQPNLVHVLGAIGVQSGLTDRDAVGQELPLEVMDPFTFLAQINKYGVDERKKLVRNLITQCELDAVAPTDFDGVPSAQRLKAWLFPFQPKRKIDDIPALWALFRAAIDGSVDENLFSRALKVVNVGRPKLTQALFWVVPDSYFPVDSQTRPWLKANGISLADTFSWQEYSACLDEIRAAHSEPFYELSFKAWSANQAESENSAEFNAKVADEYLNRRFPDTRTHTSHIVAFRTDSGRQLAFDPGVQPDRRKKVSIFVDQCWTDAEAEGRVDHYPPERGRNDHLKNHAPDLAEGKSAWAVSVGSMEQLRSLMDWYSGAPKPSIEPIASTKAEQRPTMKRQPLNQILFGPPGTGKTYATTDLAVQIADPYWYSSNIDESNDPAQREHLKSRYDELCEQGRIAFTTFHQSFAYEDFVEGIRAETSKDGAGLTYPVVDGVFKKLVDRANKATGSGKDLGVAESPRIWKISIDTGKRSAIRDACFRNNEARIGWNETGDLNVPLEDRSESQQTYWNEGTTANNRSVLINFSEVMKKGDVVLCRGGPTSVQAIGVIESDYEFDESVHDDSQFAHVRKVRWLKTDLELDILGLNDNVRLTQQTVYPLDRFSWDDLLEAVRESGEDFDVESREKPNFVLIIDEINRGNIARILGELITLLEPGKRRGAHDARVVMLPYSKKPFSVPSNIHIVGTMNTADKSLTQLDLALRRRFSFIEVPPDPSLLSGFSVFGVDIGHVLETINQRIEVLLDRDHLIGHSYFFGLRALENSQAKEAELARIFREHVVPLLQEYFFEDYERIGWVLNDPVKGFEDRFIRKDISKELSELFFADAVDQINDRRYQINVDAFSRPGAYLGILAVESSAGTDELLVSE